MKNALPRAHVPVLMLAILAVLPASATTVQTLQHIFEGRSFLYVEAEDYAALGADPEDDGWKVVSIDSPITSLQGLDILAANSNVSGKGLLDDVGGSFHTDTAIFEVQFTTPGSYQLYTRHTMFDRNGNGNYANEDSLFLSPAFNLDSNGDWVGFQGFEFDEQDFTVDIPIPGFALDPDGFKASTADSNNDGWLAIRDWGVKSAGVVTFPNDTAGPEWNGNFNWYHRPTYISSNASGSYDGEYGFKTEFVVAPEQVGQTLTFEIGSREPYAVLDGFLFIQDDNVDLLDLFTQSELDAVLPIPPNADFDSSGSVDGADLSNWTSGFGTGSGAGTIDGDADGDQDVDGLDYLYWQRQHQLATLIAVPEPSALSLIALIAITFDFASRRHL